jgi:hypothetical protein
MRNVLDRGCRENQNTHFISITHFLMKIIPFMGIWKNNVESGRPQMTIRYMRNACLILKATDTHSEYVILIAFPLQQWLHVCASVLCYMYSACLVLNMNWFTHQRDRNSFCLLQYSEVMACLPDVVKKSTSGGL